MSTLRRFLLVDSAAHGEIVDQLVCQHVRDEDHNLGNRWSGVYVRVNPDGTEIYGVLWGGDPQKVYGEPAAHPELLLVSEQIDENGASDWQELPEPDVIIPSAPW